MEKEFLNLLLKLDPYVNHALACSTYLDDCNPASDYCTCGYSSVILACQQMVAKLRTYNV